MPTSLEVPLGFRVTGRSVLRLLLVLGLVGGLLAAPAGAGGLEPSSEAPAIVQPTATVGDAYWDVCGDGPPGPLDLRRVQVGVPSSSDLRFAAIACDPWTVADLGDGAFLWRIWSEPSSGTDHDWAVEIQRVGGGIEIVVYTTPSTNRATWVETHRTAASRADDWTAYGDVPFTALQSETFTFVVESHEAGARRDTIPEENEPRVAFPSDCERHILDRATVVVEPGKAHSVARAARGIGLQPSPVTPGSGIIDVGGVDDRDLDRLGRLPGVVTASRPVLLDRLVTPDDPFYGHQWGLDQINAPAGWEIAHTSGVALAVIDDGIDARRTDLAGRVAAGHDTRFNRTLPAGVSSDRGGHGTAVAGIATARGNDGHGMAGVDWGATIVPYRVSDAEACMPDAAVADAIERAVDRGVAVINISLGTTERSAAIAHAVDRAEQRGVVVVAAAGNSKEFGNESFYPASFETVIGVGATTRDRTAAAYSTTGESVYLVAPGGDASWDPGRDILSLCDLGRYCTWAGTSFAAPHVAGALTLYLSLHPTSPALVREALALTSVDLGSSDTYGHGLLDLGALLRHALRGDISHACPDGRVPDSGFTDIAGNAHERAIHCVAWWDVVRGVGGGLYAPQRSVTRGQMATFVANMIIASEGSLPPAEDQGFEDVAGHAHERAINRLAAAGIVSGRTATTYEPDRRVNRAQMATFLVNAWTHRTGETLTSTQSWFDDISGNVHEDRINAAAEAGFTTGRAPRTYDPGADVLRSQMASFLARPLNRLVVEELTVPPDEKQ
jgi:subtilisin family serine protease